MEIILTKLLLAHIIGDFFLQPEKWVKSKEEKTWRSPHLYLHVAVHFSLIMILLQDLALWDIALFIAGTHLLIDLLKTGFQREETRLVWFISDQIAHVAVILFIWYHIWVDVNLFPLSFEIWIVLTGLLFITYPASIFIQELMEQWNDQIIIDNSESLSGAGRFIGILERLFVFTAVVAGYLQIIGFLLAAKSIFRFGDLTRSKDRKLTEYILVGTLLSFLIAIATGMAVGYFIN
jgi:hypothetical protein